MNQSFNQESTPPSNFTQNNINSRGNYRDFQMDKSIHECSNHSIRNLLCLQLHTTSCKATGGTSRRYPATQGRRIILQTFLEDSQSQLCDLDPYHCVCFQTSTNNQSQGQQQSPNAKSFDFYRPRLGLMHVGVSPSSHPCRCTKTELFLFPSISGRGRACLSSTRTSWHAAGAGAQQTTMGGSTTWRKWDFICTL